MSSFCAVCVRRLTLLLLMGLLSGTVARAQTATVRGFVTGADDGQAMQAVNVAVEAADGTLLGAISDADGFFIITRIPPGRYAFRASFIGYETYRDTLDLTPDATRLVEVALTPSRTELAELVVEAEQEGGASLLGAGLQAVRPRDIDLIPAPDVSGDLVGYLSTMPGIVSLGDRGGQLFIRGGEPSHNMTLLDGMYVYQPFHILGFYSAFASDIMSSADVYAGGFGSQYSGRMSSVIDVHTRNGNKRAFRRTFSLAPFLAFGLLEGPLIRDKVSFLASGRASTIERFAGRYIGDPLPYDFGDFYGKIHAILTDNQQLSLSGLYTYDRGTLANEADASADEEIRWWNTAYGARYLLAPRQLPILGEVLFSISRLNVELGTEEAPSRTSDINGFNVAVNITNFSGLSKVFWGFFLRSPELATDLSGALQERSTDRSRPTNAGGYLEPDLYVGHGLRIRTGLLAQLYGNKGFRLEPRLRVTWQGGPHQVHAAGGLYHQEIAGLNDRRDATNVFTAWTDTPTGKISRAVHVLMGYRVSPSASVTLSAEGYYKNLKDLYVAEWTAFPRFTARQQPADGRVLGLDLRLELRRPRFYGFINYGLSSVEYYARQEALVFWYGDAEVTFRPPHDRRHQVNALATFSLLGFDLSVRWNYGSGLPYNQVRGFDGFILMNGPVDLTEAPGQSRIIYDRPFGGILPAYHRLDVSIERVFTYGEDSYITLQAGAINTYDRSNLFALDVVTLRRVDQLPLIPTAGIKFEF